MAIIALLDATHDFDEVVDIIFAGLLQRPPISRFHGSVFQPLLENSLGSSFASPHS